jgi:hypothetical protein
MLDYIFDTTSVINSGTIFVGPKDRARADFRKL